jgi:hypothetical protein
MRSEEEVNQIIEEMMKRTKGKYITQACAFNKTCPRQMAMLKKALMSSASFSGLVKEMLALRFDDRLQPKMVYGVQQQGMSQGFTEPPKPKTKNYGNFI